MMWTLDNRPHESPPPAVTNTAWPATVCKVLNSAVAKPTKLLLQGAGLQTYTGAGVPWWFCFARRYRTCRRKGLPSGWLG